MLDRAISPVTKTLAGFFLVLLAAGILPIGHWLSGPLVERQLPRHADAIVVLGGGVEDAETPSAVTLHRLRHGLRLFRQGFAPLVVLTGGNPLEPTLPESGVMARVAVMEFGLSTSSLIVERDAARTATQAQAVARIARERGIRSVLLVTSAIHSLRAARAFRKTGLEVISTPAGAHAPPRRQIALAPHDVLHRIGGLGTIGYEYGAILLYWWREWV